MGPASRTKPDAIRPGGGAPRTRRHNAYAQWGPPPSTTRSAIMVGYDPSDTAAWVTACRPAGTVRTGTDNNEEGG